MTSIASLRILKVVELDQTHPNCGQKLISPNLVQVVDWSVNNIVYHPVKERFFLVNEIVAKHPLLSDNKKDEP